MGVFSGVAAGRSRVCSDFKGPRRGGPIAAAVLLCLLAGSAGGGQAGERTVPRCDRLGDELPPGAVARWGTLRLRPGIMVWSVDFDPLSGKLAAGVLWGGLLFYDGGDGRLLARWPAEADRDVDEMDRLLDGLNSALGGPPRSPGVTRVRYSPDGSRVAELSGSALRLKDRAGEPVMDPVPIDTGGDDSLVFSADGRLLCTRRDSRRVLCLWPGEGRRRSYRFEAQRLRALALAPDGSRLAVAGDRGTVWMLDPAGGRRRAAVRLGSGVYALRFAGGAGRLLAGLTDGSLWRLDAAGSRGWRKTRLLRAACPHGSGSWIQAIALYGGGEQLAFCAGDCVYTRALAGDGAARLLGHHPGGVRDLAVSPDGARLASAGGEVIHLWDLASGRRIDDHPGHEQGVGHLAVHPQGGWAYTGGDQGAVWAWPIADPAAPRAAAADRRAEPGGQARSARTTPPGQQVEAKDRAAAPAPRRLLAPSGQRVTALALSPDGRRLAVLLRDGALHRFALAAADPSQARALGPVQLAGRFAHALRFAPDGERLWVAMPTEPHGEPGAADAAAGAQRGVLALDFASGTITGRLDGLDSHVYAIHPAPDGRLAVALGLGELLLLDPQQQQPARQVPARGRPTAYTYSPDGTLLAYGGRSGRVFLRTARHHRPFHMLAGHRLAVADLAFSPDGRQLASAARDSTIRLWSVASGALLAEYPHAGEVAALAFTPDGEHLIGCTRASSCLLWRSGARRRAPVRGPREPLVVLPPVLAGAPLLAAERRRIRRAVGERLRRQRGWPVVLVEPERVERLIALAREHRWRADGPRCVGEVPLDELLQRELPRAARAVTALRAPADPQGGYRIEVRLELADGGLASRPPVFSAAVAEPAEPAAWLQAAGRLSRRPPERPADEPAGRATGMLSALVAAEMPRRARLELSAPQALGPWAAAPTLDALAAVQPELDACLADSAGLGVRGQAVLVVGAGGAVSRCAIDSRQSPPRRDLLDCACRALSRATFAPGEAGRRLGMRLTSVGPHCLRRGQACYAARVRVLEPEPLRQHAAASWPLIEPELAGCFARAAIAGPTALRAKVRIAPDGRVGLRRLHTRSQLPAATRTALKRCIAEALAHTPLPCSPTGEALTAQLQIRGRPDANPTGLDGLHGLDDLLQPPRPDPGSD